MGRVGVAISGLVICGLMSGCGSSGGPAAAKSSTESIRVGHLLEIFDGPLPADSAQAKVINGFRAGLILWDKSQEAQKLVSPVTSDVTGTALNNLKETLTRELTPGQQSVPAGVDRNFKTQVTALSGASATVTTCDDGSKFDEVNPSTGVVNPAYNATPDEEYFFVKWQMTQLDGHWAISGVTVANLPNALAKPCQPVHNS
jgi:hypothetical protein